MKRKLMFVTLIIILAMLIVAPVEAGLRERIEYRDVEATAAPYTMPTYTPVSITPTPYPLPLVCWSGGCYYPAR